MSAPLEQVYDLLLLDHIRAARNYGLEAGGPAPLEISNPLCGDTLALQVVWSAEGRLALRFQCACCGISMGNASLMTELVSGRTATEASAIAARVFALLTGAAVPPAEPVVPAFRLLAAIAEQLPARRTCASLGWQALEAVLAGHATPATAREIRP
jgi:nitrogen fixation NifU-like protein